MQGCSSDGRASVSKTECRGFDSCRPCQIFYMELSMAGNNISKKAEEPGGFKKLGIFFKEAYIETRFKTTWPSKTELKQFTIVVLVAVILAGIYFGALDFAIGRIIKAIMKF